MAESEDEAAPRMYVWCTVLVDECRRVPGFNEQAVCDVLEGWPSDEWDRYIAMPYTKRFDLLRRIGRR